ncbi:hypothetical protein [Dyadobacter jiangsuensis]|uniref:Uncharacterized protein n=1 Tax=Dyadobacter jiangsuensis TaxID=1591085 RepID=A0A2P8FSQ4_9BACT|nr:hypothetical protein [Dyadobacter jiangsuensis]PSL24758.1 hypothetical protein CLV60_113182 [Dyadobacter jiangsuensis]
MRRLASIGLLILLLYNMFGLSCAVLFFEKDYQIAASKVTGESLIRKMYLPSLPYSGDLEMPENIEGLVRQDGQFYNPTHVLHQNDTLYVTLQSNEAARDHFFELANAIQVLSDPQADMPQSPYGKAIKLLSNLLKIYIPNTQQFPDHSGAVARQIRLSANNRYVAAHYMSRQTSQASPPPEYC